MTPREQLTQALQDLEEEHGMRNIVEALSDMAYGHGASAAPNRSLKHCWSMVQEQLYDVRDLMDCFLHRL